MKEIIFFFKYYYVKEFLIFMFLVEEYYWFIDIYYYGYILKNLNKLNVNLLSNLIKVGSFVLLLEINDFYSFYKYFINKNDFNNNFINVVWIYEKNYRVLFFLYFFFVCNSFYDNYFMYLKNYEIYKVFYGEELIDKYFKEELEEFESLCFIYLNWMFWLVYDLKIVDILVKILKKEYFDIL